MAVRGTGLLVVTWCAVLIGMGALTFVAHDGLRAFVWIGGYIAAFAIYLVWSRKTSKSGAFIWGVIASLLPLAVAFTFALSPTAAAIDVVVVVAVGYSMSASVGRAQQLAQEGIRAVGTVLEVVSPRMFNVVVNNVYLKRTVHLEIRREDNVAPYEARYRGLYMLDDVPTVGAQLALRVDPNDPGRIVLDREAGALAEANKAATTQTYLQPDVTGRLNDLAQLHREGRLTDVEFAAAKRAVLSRR
ncbi:MAG TPA: hypothetical protein VE442_23880 [Jatrophihabitans sp.]|nr:hypothetical protein [Jatrophihabitans sp.]